MPPDRVAQFNQTIINTGRSLADMNRVLRQSTQAVNQLQTEAGQAVATLTQLRVFQQNPATYQPAAAYDPAIRRAQTAVNRAAPRQGIPQYEKDRLQAQLDNVTRQRNDALADLDRQIAATEARELRAQTQTQTVRNLRPSVEVRRAVTGLEEAQQRVSTLQQKFVTNEAAGKPTTRLTARIDAEIMAMESYITIIRQWEMVRDQAIANMSAAYAPAQNPNAAINQQLPPVPNLTPAQQRDASRLEEQRRTGATFWSPTQKNPITGLDESNRWIGAQKLATDRGFSQGSGKIDITESGLSGIQQATLRVKNGITGVNEVFKVFTDTSGKVLPSTSRQFSSFASSVGRDFRELAKWTIAIGLIYGPMRKIQELITLMISNEVRLADASIAVSDSTLKMGDIFDIASDAANAMGENVNDVIVNFSQAYQATGGMGTAMERTTIATKLMSDALVLSKLSSLSASESIDVLSAALRQSEEGFGGSTKLLDQWVKVSTQAANVSLDTLAIGFSVLGEAANAAGLSNEELTAILAVTSDTMGVTGKEAANMARAFVVGFQSDKATAALEAVGISTKTVSGEMRTLLQIQEDLYNASNLGTISPETYFKLTTDIGGGTRRQAGTAGFIQQTPRIAQIVAAQSKENSEGAAAAALAKQLDTVQTSMTRLQNAFQSLAQSLGDEGGLLDVFGAVLNLLTSIVTMADKAFEVMGKAGPMLAVALGAGALIKSQGPLWASGFATKVGLGVAGMTGGPGAGGISVPGTFAETTTAIMLGGRKKADSFRLADSITGTTRPGGILGPQITAGIASALLVGALPAIQNMSRYSSGEDVFGKQKAGADIVGAGIGAAVGTALIGNPLIGASIGTAISEAFISASTKELSLLDLTAAKIDRGLPSEKKAAEMTLSELMGGAGESTGFSGTLRQAAAGAVAWLKNPSDKGMLGTTIDTERDTATSVLYSWLTPGQKALVDKRKADAIASGEIPTIAEYQPFSEEQKLQQTTYGSFIDTQKKAREQEFLDKLIGGSMTPTAYTGKLETLNTFEEKATRFFTAFGEEFISVDKDINTAQEAYQSFLDIFSYGSEEQIQSLSTMVTGVADLTNQIELLKASGTEADLLKIPELEAEIARLKGLLAQSTSVMAQGTHLQMFPVPDVLNKNGALQATDETLTTLITRARELQRNDRSSPALGEYALTDSEITTINNQLPEVALRLADGGDGVVWAFTDLAERLTGSAENIEPDFIQQAIQEQLDKGTVTLLVEAQVPQWGGDIDINSTQKPALDAWINYYQNKMHEYGITDIKKDYVQTVRYEDGQWGQIKGDSRAYQAAMAQMIDLQTKELEQGVWNIPAGQSFMVPITSLTAANQPQGTGGTSIPEPPPSTPYEDIPTGMPDIAIDTPKALTAEELRAARERRLYQLDIPEYPAVAPDVKQKALDALGTVPDEYYKEALARKYAARDYSDDTRTREQVSPTSSEKTRSMFENLIPSLLNYFDQLFKGATGDFNPFGAGVEIPTKDALTAGLNAEGLTKLFGGIFGGISQQESPLTRVDIRLDSKVQLIVDGRMLAQIIKPYLLSDITRANSAIGRGTAKEFIV